MKHYSCWVRLDGDTRHEVQRDNVTAAELAIISAMHGEGSVIEIREVGQSNPNHAALRGSLQQKYAHSQNGAKVFNTVFPGAHSRLPESIEEIGLTCTRMPPREFVPDPMEAKVEPEIFNDPVESVTAAPAESETVSVPESLTASGKAAQELADAQPEPTDPMAKARAAKKAKALAAAEAVPA